jgi:hypothetical protein
MDWFIRFAVFRKGTNPRFTKLHPAPSVYDRFLQTIHHMELAGHFCLEEPKTFTVKLVI